MRDKITIDWDEVLDSGASLPSLPGVAVEIVRIANDPETSVDRAIAVLSKDPAITGKLLRAVNSAFYAKPRQVESLKQAVVIMGMNSALSLALSFSLLNTFRGVQNEGLDYELYWRRSLLCASAARVIAEHIKEVAVEEVFLAALLQDIGMLVLDRTQPGFYAELGDRQMWHPQVVSYERERVHPDHAVIGGLLLRKWQLPDRTVNTVFSSHDISVLDSDAQIGQFARCVALSSVVADLFLGTGKLDQYNQVVVQAYRLLGLDESQVQTIIETLAASIPSVEALFSVRLVSEQDVAEIIGQAYEVLRQRLAAEYGESLPQPEPVEGEMRLESAGQ